MVNPLFATVSIAALLACSNVYASSLEEKRAKEQPLLECRVAISTLIKASQLADIKLEAESDEQVYGKQLDLLAKYFVALLATVYDNSDRSLAAQQTMDYIDIRVSETADQQNAQDMDGFLRLVNNCVDNEEALTRDGMVLAEDIFGYGSAVTLKERFRKKFEESIFDSSL